MLMYHCISLLLERKIKNCEHLCHTRHDRYHFTCSKTLHHGCGAGGGGRWVGGWGEGVDQRVGLEAGVKLSKQEL